MRTKFPNPDDILNFTLTIEPDEGLYKAGAFHFTFAINENFPHEPPKVKCTQKIYHPNIDLEGNVCLNILREDWKPVLNLNAIIVGLQVRRLGAQEGAKAHEEGQYSLSSGAYFSSKGEEPFTNEWDSNQFLFLEPNASDPLNKEAAEDLRSNREAFKRNVRTAMGGGTVKGNTYVRTLK